MTQSNRLIITGALGHIGSYLIRQPWVTRFDEVLLIDNLLTQRYASLFNLPKNFHYIFLENDIMKLNWDQVLKEQDTIIHLAAITDAESSFDKKDLVEKINFEGLQLVANTCLKQGARIIFPSTTSVYGSQASIVDETCTDLAPQSPYAESKIKSEQYLQDKALKGLACTILRLGTIFGESIGMRFHTAVNKFIWQARFGKPISVWKTALKQYRPYLSLDDASSAIEFVINNHLFKGKIYNVVTKNYTVEEIIAAIRKFVPKLAIDFVDSAIMNQLSYHVNANKIKKAGFEFKGDLETSILNSLKLLGINDV
ncbi:MAG: hypothetical protein ACD_73C00822G0003 [uncultured bacterium]|nr:MAG: hypothetical protein ACD_73C00822G0003 [uncultured bacterium]